MKYATERFRFFLISILCLFPLLAHAQVTQWTALGPESPGTAVEALAIDPVTPTTVYAASTNGVFKSIDSGKTWRGSSQGLPRRIVRQLVVNPLTPTILYAGISDGTDGLVFKSVDGGATWSHLRTFTLTNVVSITIDPLAPTTLYVGTGSGHKGDFWRSTDSGVTWMSLFAGLPSGVRVLAINPQDPTTLYAGTFDGVYKSTSGGSTWIVINNGGVTHTAVYDLLIDPTQPETLYVSMPQGLFKTTNGEQWGPIGNGLSVRNVADLVIDPLDPAILYAGTLSGGVFKSTDGGATWSPMNAGLTHTEVLRLAIDRDGGTLYAGTAGGAFAFQLGLAAPGPDLTGAWRSLRAACKESHLTWRCKLKGKFRVRNVGVERAPTPFLTMFYLSPDPVLSSDDILLATKATGKLRSGKGKKRKWKVVHSSIRSTQYQYVIAVVDSSNAVTEENERNNRIVFGPLP